MKKFIMVTVMLFVSSAVLAGPQCTTTEQKHWLDKDKFQEDLKSQGYEIKVFKVTAGNCYEIYGWNKDKKKVEIYFDPVSGKPVKENVEK